MANITGQSFVKSLPLIDKYFKIVAIFGLCWALKYQTSRAETLEQEKEVIRKEKEQMLHDEIQTWRKVKENNDEIFDRYIKKLNDETKDHNR